MTCARSLVAAVLTACLLATGSSMLYVLYWFQLVLLPVAKRQAVSTRRRERARTSHVTSRSRP